MQKLLRLSLAIVLCLALHASAQMATPLSLIHRYQLPASIKGHFDHFAVDPKGERIFGTAVEDQVLVVFDLNKGEVIQAVHGIEEPRGVVYRADLGRLYVSDGGGAVRIFDSKTFKPLKTLKVLVDADPVTYDPATARLFGQGNRKHRRLLCLRS